MAKHIFHPQRVGAWRWDSDKARFCVWAPSRRRVDLMLKRPACQHQDIIPMEKDPSGYWTVVCDHVPPSTRYAYRLDGDLIRPDPASLQQPEGVHAFSEFVDVTSYPFSDADYQPRPFKDWVIYEMHVGLFTKEGTFDGVRRKLKHLIDLGVNAIELMPVCVFPGRRNWGYDGVYPFSVHTVYGGVEGLQRLIDACHRKGLAVILDVVYNHLGPEGNYLRDFGPYFTQKYKTPWGEALNYDEAGSPGVRAFFVQNALHWFEHFHIDALRLDAIHGIFDFSAKHILAEISQAVAQYKRRTGRTVHLIAESDLNDVRVLHPRTRHGFGLDAQWLDDFHHASHVALTQEQQGYYRDFDGVPDLAKAIKQGFVYDGGYSLYRKRFFGSSSKHIAPKRFVAFIQNHDQIGNRLNGERLTHLVDFERLKLAAVVLLTSPFVPLLFMGEEFGSRSPFLYFIDHGNDHLIRAVREGRKREFRSFDWKAEPPDPAAVDTFERSRLNWSEKKQRRGRFLYRLYQDLLKLRRRYDGYTHTPHGRKVRPMLHNKGLFIHYPSCGLWVMMNFAPQTIQGKGVPWLPSGSSLRRLLDTTDKKYGGRGTSFPLQIGQTDDWIMPPVSGCVYQIHQTPPKRAPRQ